MTWAAPLRGCKVMWGSQSRLQPAFSLALFTCAPSPPPRRGSARQLPTLAAAVVGIIDIKKEHIR
jgi:hypothetical protein